MAKHFLYHDPSKWLLDSGSSCNICSDWQVFKGFKKLPCSKKIGLGNKQKIEAIGTGSVPLRPNLTLEDVHYIPDFSVNLLSIRKLDKLGFKATFVVFAPGRPGPRQNSPPRPALQCGAGHLMDGRGGAGPDFLTPPLIPRSGAPLFTRLHSRAPRFSSVFQPISAVFRPISAVNQAISTVNRPISTINRTISSIN